MSLATGRFSGAVHRTRTQLATRLCHADSELTPLRED